MINHLIDEIIQLCLVSQSRLETAQPKLGDSNYSPGIVTSVTSVTEPSEE